MTPRRNEREPLDRVLEEYYANPGRVIEHTDAVLRLERHKEAVVVAWLSQMTVTDFLERLTGAAEDAVLTASRRSADVPAVDAAKLRHPTKLTRGEEESIYLVRADYENAAVVWERTGEDFSDVAVLSDTWKHAVDRLIPLLPPEEQQSVELQVAEIAAS